jgi:PDZ domain
VITQINPTSRAAESGLQTGDVIIEVGNRAVNTPADVRKMVDEARAQSKRSILLRIKRGDAMSFVAVPIGRVPNRLPGGRGRSRFLESFGRDEARMRQALLGRRSSPSYPYRDCLSCAPFLVHPLRAAGGVGLRRVLMCSPMAAGSGASPTSGWLYGLVGRSGPRLLLPPGRRWWRSRMSRDFVTGGRACHCDASAAPSRERALVALIELEKLAFSNHLSLNFSRAREATRSALPGGGFLDEVSN